MDPGLILWCLRFTGTVLLTRALSLVIVVVVVVAVALECCCFIILDFSGFGFVLCDLW